MEPLSAAEELPALYRALLDRVAQIEAEGRRAAAYRLRTQATRIYSRAGTTVPGERCEPCWIGRWSSRLVTEPAKDRESQRKRVPAT